MPRSIYHYRPQRSLPESLEAIFVGREHLMTEVLERLKKWTPGASRQHYLYIGPRGIGKTHVLSLLAHRVRISPQLSKMWVPVVFPEESYRITRISDLLVETLSILGEDTGDQEVLRVYEQVQYDDDENRVTDLALDALRKFHRDSGKGLLLMIENVNRILENQIKSKTHIHLLRKILIEEDWLVTVFSSPTFLAAVTREDEPLFEFFQVRFLQELTQDQQLMMLEKLAEHEGNDAFKDYLEKYKSRLLALYHFTGGNPRLTVMLYDLISYQSIMDVQAELERLLNEITPFYQDRMKDIGELNGKLVEIMSSLPEGCTPTELAREARMDAKTVRTLLGRMEKEGYVRHEERRNKRTVYIIPERLFRIWHQVNHSRAAKGQIKYLLEFFSTWYQTREERDAVWNEITGNLQAASPYDERNRDLSEYLDYIIAVSEGSEKYIREFDRLRKVMLPNGKSEVNDELKRLDQIYPQDGDYFIHKGYFLTKDLGDYEQGLLAFEKAEELKPDDVIPIINQVCIIDKIFSNLDNIRPSNVPHLIFELFKFTFRTGEQNLIADLLTSAKAKQGIDVKLLKPYEIASEYLQANRDQGIIDRQQPEMREAVMLLVNLFDGKVDGR